MTYHEMNYWIALMGIVEPQERRDAEEQAKLNR